MSADGHGVSRPTHAGPVLVGDSTGPETVRASGPRGGGEGLRSQLVDVSTFIPPEV